MHCKILAIYLAVLIAVCNGRYVEETKSHDLLETIKHDNLAVSKKSVNIARDRALEVLRDYYLAADHGNELDSYIQARRSLTDIFDNLVSNKPKRIADDIREFLRDFDERKEMEFDREDRLSS
ncbi:unnamed protein product [Adineta ricciae]|uniref:Uncharacterized protein n=1 Tax=Adineta ricciae TaxID=249248 RepID=A0A815AI73_ADIRI|nr:unnamed protein product [Adineta ricciae]